MRILSQIAKVFVYTLLVASLYVLPTHADTKKFMDYNEDTTPVSTDFLLKSAGGAGTTRSSLTNVIKKAHGLSDGIALVSSSVLITDAMEDIIIGYTVDTTPTSDDLVPTVNNPSGTPSMRKVALSNLGKGIKLDDLATPDDNTDLNSTTSYHGLLPKLNNNAATYMDGTGAWSTPSGSTDDQVASEVPFTPTGDLASTDVQAALAEVDTEKLGQTQASLHIGAIAMCAPTDANDFLVFRVPSTITSITITKIYGVLLSGTNVIGGLDICTASDGTSCTAVDADITFDGGLDYDDGTLTNPTGDTWDWIKWHTTSVSSPGCITIQFEYTVSGLE